MEQSEHWKQQANKSVPANNLFQVSENCSVCYDLTKPYESAIATLLLSAFECAASTRSRPPTPSNPIPRQTIFQGCTPDRLLE
eukprot:721456-Amphidinium_carterae.1